MKVLCNCLLLLLLSLANKAASAVQVERERERVSLLEILRCMQGALSVWTDYFSGKI
jgi:hypothetical protein